MPSKPEIMVAMSGGVDSSTAALLLKEQGFGIAGMFMKNWEEDDRLGECSAAQDAEDARQVATKIGIDLHTRNFASEYWDHVFEDFLSEYRAGRTPNPDILCNREIKFKTFLDHATDLGADKIATGHYARTDIREGTSRLMRGRDPNKDQSYFLYAISAKQLSQTLFPVGELEKPDVRQMAADFGLPVFDKKDSVGICFIGERNFREFLGQYLDADPGPVCTPEGQEIGQHEGLMFHTLGQRQGLGIGGVRGFEDQPWYVLHKDLDQNILYVGQGHDHPWLQSTKLMASQLNWISGNPPGEGERLTAKVRYRQPDQQCCIEAIDEGRVIIGFTRPQRAVTPGQSVVLYAGEECLGGGIIQAMNAPPCNQEQW